MSLVKYCKVLNGYMRLCWFKDSDESVGKSYLHLVRRGGWELQMSHTKAFIGVH